MNLTLLGIDNYFGNNKLSIFEKMGVKAAITDFAILSGGYVSNNCFVDYGDNKLADRTGYYWSRTDDGDDDARVVDYYGSKYDHAVIRRDGGIRAALPYSVIEKISSNKVRGNYNVLELEYGEYPQQVASRDIQSSLEYLYSCNSNSLEETGKGYTVDSMKYDDYDKVFKPKTYKEYLYNGKKYVRVIANTCFSGADVTLSNGDSYKDGDAVWVEVSKIKWLIDEEKEIAITKNIIASGVQFKNIRDYKGDFSKTDMAYYIDNFLSKEIEQSFIISNVNNINEDVETNRKKNPYNFSFDNVSEEDIVKGAIESDIAIFLHGRSSEGKSARVKQLDPDCEIVYLLTASYESLNGKSVYNQATGEMIDIEPTWYKRLCKKCEDEPDKVHIVFFDEISNAPPTIQSAAFNIILNKEIDGKWKLPANSRVAAAGNETKDSLSAYEVSEPLYNRFAHVYINTTVESWLDWAVTEDEEYERLNYKEEKRKYKIHPAIYSFISYRGEKALRSEYTGERPNADPRKWEMASRMLEKTNKPEMLRALVGEEITRDFIEFCNQEVITLEDVINDNYTDADLSMNFAQKCATVAGLSAVGMDNLEKVRNFAKILGDESCAQFDSMWSRGNEKRLEQIAVLKLKDAEERGKSR